MTGLINANQQPYYLKDQTYGDWGDKISEGFMPYVLDHCDLKTFATAKQVCKAWHQSAMQSELYKQQQAVLNKAIIKQEVDEEQLASSENNSIEQNVFSAGIHLTKKIEEDNKSWSLQFRTSSNENPSHTLKVPVTAVISTTESFYNGHVKPVYKEHIEPIVNIIEENAGPVVQSVKPVVEFAGEQVKNVAQVCLPLVQQAIYMTHNKAKEAAPRIKRELVNVVKPALQEAAKQTLNGALKLTGSVFTWFNRTGTDS